MDFQINQVLLYKHNIHFTVKHSDFNMKSTAAVCELEYTVSIKNINSEEMHPIYHQSAKNP
jgi:hypothetical protein